MNSAGFSTFGERLREAGANQFKSRSARLACDNCKFGRKPFKGCTNVHPLPAGLCRGLR